MMVRFIVGLSLVCLGEGNSKCNPSDRVVHGCWGGLEDTHGKPVWGNTNCGVIQLARCRGTTRAFTQLSRKPADGDAFGQDEKQEHAGNSKAVV